MRLTDHQAAEIRRAAARHFGADAEVRLFGSRVDDSRRGGDIDLYVETDLRDPDDVFRREIAMLVDLNLALGEQKIDLVVRRRGQTDELPIHRVARDTGVRL
ncbi:MAG: nucleotidyltransferase domain-containing protein [Hydrogenophaga sp.]|uniref:nucleotidyltransferase domain-containing protein n=1 Tax=Hydrogenophaga sp. TaxID=1904254 RepID=UPI003D0E13C2